MRVRLTSHFLIRSALFALVGVALYVGSVATPAVRAATVVTPVAQQVSPDAPAQSNPTIVRSRYVLMAAGVLPKPSAANRQPGLMTVPIVLDLFDDLSVVAVFDRFDPNPRGVTWVGHVQGSEGSTVTLVYGDDGLVQGNVLMLEGTYTIQPAPDDVRASTSQRGGVLHVIAQLDLSRQRPNAPPISVAIPATGRAAADASVAAVAQADTGDYIDVLVVYTPRVVAAIAGGEPALRSRIELLVSQTNTSYANSGVTQRIRISHAEQVPYTEATFDLSGFTDLENLRNGAPGLEGVAALRNASSADVVSMITRNDDVSAACGNAHHMAVPSPAFEAWAFSITDFWCTSTPFTFVELLGINMGLRYDWYRDNGTTPYTYAHGHINYAGVSANRFRTLMASFELCNSAGVSCQPLLRWSNPTQTFNGTPLGVPAGTRANCAIGALDANTCDADSRLVLNNTALIVANFRQSPAAPPGGFPKIAPADQATVNSSAVTLSWESAPFAVSYEYCYDTTNNDVCDTSWNPATGISAQATGLIPSTTYYWQVRALNVYGATLANGGVWWRFTRQPQLPAFFTKIAPINGAVSQPVSVTLSWETSTDAASYEYCYDTTNDSACDGSWTSTSATSALVGLSPATVYYWQVRAVNPTGSLQANSNVWWSFGTTASGPSYPVTTFAGLDAGFSGSGDGVGTAARFHEPTGVAVDQAGTVYVGDAWTIRRITPAGAVTTFAGNPGAIGSADGTGTNAQFGSVTNVAVDSAGTIYVADKFNHTIRKITPAGVVTTLAGLAGASGSTDATGSAARFNQPEGIAVDAVGTVYVADTSNHTIRKVTPGGVVTTLAGMAAVSGSANGTGSAARFFWPTGVAVDSAGTVYVTDSANNTIRRITPAGTVTTLAGLAGATGNADGVGNAARFSLPTGVAVDSAGMIFVADRNNNTIRHITPGGAVTTLAGHAMPLTPSADGFGPTARFLSPRGVAVDSSGTLYVADTLNRTIRRRGPAGLGPNLVLNANFSAGTGNWQFFATPDNSYISSAVVNGVFEFTRVTPPPGTSNSATVFQNTGQALPAGTSLIAQFALGNSSAVRKRISVLVLDHDFSDLSVCTFWLPANLPLSTYTMLTATTRAWTNASIYFYAASDGANGGAYRLDDVTLQVQTAGPLTATLCADPVAPISTNSFSSSTLLTNGDFDTGALSPWGVFGTITQQIVSGVFQFIRPTNDPPSGVVFQATGQAIAANQILTAAFQLGNSSGVRKRVTVLVHDSDFSDLSACTFWLAPGQPLSNYSYRTYTTKAWTNAMISVYPATTDALPWILLDNVTLQRTPPASAGGTQCIGPAGS